MKGYFNSYAFRETIGSCNTYLSCFVFCCKCQNYWERERKGEAYELYILSTCAYHFCFFFRVYERLFLIPISLSRHSGLLTLFCFMNCFLSTCVYHVCWYLCFGRLFITVSPSESQPGLVPLPPSHVSAYIFIISDFLRVSFVFPWGCSLCFTVSPPKDSAHPCNTPSSRVSAYTFIILGFWRMSSVAERCSRRVRVS